MIVNAHIYNIYNIKKKFKISFFTESYKKFKIDLYIYEPNKLIL